MLRRASGARPSTTMCGAASRSSSSTRLRYIARWSSSSRGIADPVWNPVQHRLRLRRFVEQRGERGHVDIPFNEGRNRPKPRQSFGVKHPDFGADPRPVIINAELDAVIEIFDRMTGEVDLADRSGVQRREIG